MNKDDKYEKKSKRIYAWSDFFKAISKFLWVIVFMIILVGLGRLFLFKSGREDLKKPRIVKKPVVTKVDWGKVNTEIEKLVKEAHKETEKTAIGLLNQWIAKNMTRVDNDFSPWYFSYWTQQKIGLKSLLYQVLHWVDSDNPTPAERITEEVQEEFSNRVLRPQIAQLEIERIINEIVFGYSSLLNEKFKDIPTEYNINPAEWDRYLNDMAIIIKNVEANRQTPLSLKAIVGVTAGGTILLFKSLKPIITKIGSKISAKFAAKAASKMAAKTGGKVAARAGGKFLGTIIAIGIIIWDVWDHYSTRKRAEPVLRQNIFDYFQEVKQSILHDPEYGIMTVIYNIEQNISENINKQAA